MASIPPHLSVEDAAVTLASIVTAGLDKPNPLDSLYSDEENCVALISRRSDLHSLLDNARVNKDYDPVRRHPSLRRTEGKNRLNTFLDEIQPAFVKFMNGSDAYDRWTPDPDLKIDSSTVAHIEALEFLATETQPAILIHRLGRFQEDVILKTRVEGIFQRGATTFLVNTSGSGKTRISFEGLCQNWGFYFTVARDGNNLGADDIGLDLYKTLDHSKDFTRHLPPPDSAIFAKALSRNIEITDARFSLVLLGRLLMFNMYSEILQAEGITEEHKRRWLLFQLLPQLPGNLSYDLFTDLKILTGKLEPDHVQDLIAVMFSKLRRIHGAQFHLFYVIDEAQIASRAHTSAFQQDSKGYPLLRQIIHTWITKSRPGETSIVVLGTDIPKDGFESAPFAGSVRWSSDTGGFDNEDDHRRYISGFLMPAYVESPAGQMFLRRVWTWCRGRHRSTDALLKALLLDGLRTPHKLLNDYIETTTTYRPTDYDDDEPFRPPINVKLLVLSPNFFTNSPLLISTIQQVLFHYLATARHPSPFSEDLTPLVSAAFGRFIDSNLSQVAMDEPMFLIRAARWLCEAPKPEAESTHDCLTILRHHRANATSRSLTSFMAFYLIRAFDHGATLSSVFSFLHKLDWAGASAELFALSGKEGWAISCDGDESSLPRALAASPGTLAGLGSWLDDPMGAAFCLTPTPDPDLIFHLKLEDGRLLRVILHAAATETLLRSVELKSAISRFDPNNLFRDTADDVDAPERITVVAKLLATAFPERGKDVDRTPPAEGLVDTTVRDKEEDDEQEKDVAPSDRTPAAENLVDTAVPDKEENDKGKDVAPSDRTPADAKLLDTARAAGPFKLLRVIASFPAENHLSKLSPKPKPSTPVAKLNSGLFKSLLEDIPASELLETLVAAVTTGKRKGHFHVPSYTQRKKPRLASESPPSRKLRSTKKQKTS